MASRAVDLIVRAIQDDDFRNLLFRDKERALSKYELNEKEVVALTQLERETFDRALAEMGAELERRIARGGAEIDGVRLTTLDYPVIEDFDGG